MTAGLSTTTRSVALLLTAALVGRPDAVVAQESLPQYLFDRGNGVAASIFGTYIEKGQLLVYPFFEYARDHNKEYNPAEFGLPLNQDFRGKYRATAEQLFIGYGVTDWLALEFEFAHMHATLEKAPADPVTPAKITESGVGDFEAQVRARLRNESARGPEVFTYGDVTFPSNQNKLLIGDKDWDFRPGVGVTKGFSWGTLTGKIGAEYNREESHPILGELALEYLKRLSPATLLFLAIEGGEGGAPDEADFVSGLHWSVGDRVVLRLDNSVGLQSKSADWVPQLGVMLSFQ
jgi:hypothetical protein